MCGRFTRAYTWQQAYEYYNLTGTPANLRPSYNVAPTQTVDIIRNTEVGRALSGARWGLIPAWWKKPLKDLPTTFNARSETAAEKPMFRSAFAQRRCLVPASGFYEWKREDGAKQSYLIHRTDGLPLSFAGLWETWTGPDEGETVTSCTILTMTADDVLAPIHSRMPCMLEQADFDRWLDDGDLDGAGAGNAHAITYHAVDTRVGNVRNNDPGLMEAVAPESGAEPETGLLL